MFISVNYCLFPYYRSYYAKGTKSEIRRKSEIQNTKLRNPAREGQRADVVATSCRHPSSAFSPDGGEGVGALACEMRRDIYRGAW